MMEVNVTMELHDAVQQLFDMTTRKDFKWEPHAFSACCAGMCRRSANPKPTKTAEEAMGIGRDGSWATHKSFRVLQAIDWAAVG